MLVAHLLEDPVTSGSEQHPDKTKATAINTAALRTEASCGSAWFPGTGSFRKVGESATGIRSPRGSLAGQRACSNPGTVGLSSIGCECRPHLPPVRSRPNYGAAI